MAATTLLAYVVVRHRWRWPLAATVLVIGTFLIIDLAFFSANLLKVIEGGWVPLLLAILLCLMMSTWRQGREILAAKLRDESLPTEMFLRRLGEKPPTRVSGTAIYLSRYTDMLPNAMLHNLKHNKVLHEKVVLLTVQTEHIPRVGEDERATLKVLRPDFYHVFLKYGFMETPDVPASLAAFTPAGINPYAPDTSYFLGRETLIPSPVPPMSGWRERLFILLSKNAVSATDFFCIPTDQVVELGAQVPI